MSTPATNLNVSEGVDAFTRNLYRWLGLTPEQQEIKANTRQAELLRSRNQLNELIKQGQDSSIPFSERLNRMQAISKVIREGDGQARQDTLAAAPQLLDIRGEKLKQDDSSYVGRLRADTESFNTKQGQQIEGISRLAGEQREGELQYLQALGGVSDDFLSQVRAQTQDDREFYREMNKPRIDNFLMDLVKAAAPLGAAKVMGVI